jgi:putative MFS transporter
MTEPLVGAAASAETTIVGIGAAEPSATVTSPAAAETHSQATVRAVCAVLVYQGYAFALLGVGAPYIGKGFGLNDAGMAGMFALISLNSIAALVLSRMADRFGRRRILLMALIVTPLCSLGAALSGALAWFIAFEIVAYAAIAATFASSFVMLAEALPIAERARGQGYAGLAIGTGGGLCVILAPVLMHFGISWRWLFAVPAIGIVWVPVLAEMIPESARWEQAAATGAAAESRFADLFARAYRRRTIPLTITALLGEAAGAAVATYINYHAITVVGLTPARGSAVMLIGGTVSTIGLAIGASMAERIGRVRAVAALASASVIGVLAFYWGPPAHFACPTLWLVVAYSWFGTAGRGSVVAANAAVTELFPTALRGAIMGWLTFCVAVAAVGAQVVIALLAKSFGGLSVVVGWIALLSIPCALVWILFIDETRGLSLEAAALGAAQRSL